MMSREDAKTCYAGKVWWASMEQVVDKLGGWIGVGTCRRSKTVGVTLVHVWTGSGIRYISNGSGRNDHGPGQVFRCISVLEKYYP